mgnify:CR=1 FL=1
MNAAEILKTSIMKFVSNNITYILLAIVLLIFNCNSDKKSKPIIEQTSQELTEDQLLDSVQKQTFNYFWEGGEPNSGMARERIHLYNIYPQNDQDIVTTGGTGFGLMAI